MPALEDPRLHRCCAILTPSKVARGLSSRDGGTGRRSGLKIRRGQPRGGSTPPPGTKILKDLRAKLPLGSERQFCLVAVLVAVGFLLFRDSGEVGRESGGGFQ